MKFSDFLAKTEDSISNLFSPSSSTPPPTSPAPVAAQPSWNGHHHAHAGPRAVFAHYMVGSMSPEEANVDIQEARKMGLDAFVLNVQVDAQWCNHSIGHLFHAAHAHGFKLLFSFDMNTFKHPSEFIPILSHYYHHHAYYRYGGLPFVSTFYGGKLTFGAHSPNTGWQTEYRDGLNAAGMPTYFVPAFSDGVSCHGSSANPSNFFQHFPVADGQFNWDASWPWASQGFAPVSDHDDRTYMSTKPHGKTLMMGISPLQFKHIDEHQNWYRRGGLGLVIRISQILAAAPEFVQIQTWNDAGESHYIGRVHDGAIAGSNIGRYTDGFDHSGWQNILGPFTAAFKHGIRSADRILPSNGKTVQGVFWHSTLLAGARCSGDPLGQPDGAQNLQDVVEVAVIIAPGVTARVDVFSGGRLIGRFATQAGLNAWEVNGMAAGQVRVDVVDAWNNLIVGACGPIEVLPDSDLCNHNPQVVALN